MDMIQNGGDDVAMLIAFLLFHQIVIGIINYLDAALDAKLNFAGLLTQMIRFHPTRQTLTEEFFKWANNGHFLFIFVLFKLFTSYNCRLQRDPNSNSQSRRRVH